MISAAGGRFPRAWLQSPRRYTPAGLSAHAPVASLSVQKTSAIPAGVAAFRFNQQKYLTT